MEINEATRRIFQLHWRLIAVCVLASLAIFGTLGAIRPRTFTSSARIVLDTPDPQSVAEATANADTVRAIATGSDQVAAALSQVGVSRDPIKFAKKYINVQAIGSSGVLKLSVTDPSPRVAADLANALATQVIATRLRVGRGQAAVGLPQLEQRIAALDTNIATLRAEVQALDKRIATTGSASASALTQTRSETQSVLDFLIAQRVDLISQRTGLVTPATTVPDPSIIQVASPPPKADPSEVPQLIGLGLLLGLVVGLGGAASVEAFRPTLVGSSSLGAALGIFPLADLGGRRFRRQRITAAAERILLAGGAVGARTIELVPVAMSGDLGPLAAKIEWELRMLRLRRPARATASRDAGLIVEVFDPASSEPSAAIVVVAPEVVPKSVLNETIGLLKILKKPVLGLITYRTLPRPEEIFARPTEQEESTSVVVTEEPSLAHEPPHRAYAAREVQRTEGIKAPGPGILRPGSRE